MDGLALLERARTAGLTVEVEGDLLAIEGPPEEEALALAILGRKSEIVALLRTPTAGRCLDCGAQIERRYARCEPCARIRADVRRELPAPCPECRAFHWCYESVDVRRCVACGHVVELPPLDPNPRLLTLDDGGLASWTECRCASVPAGQHCRACAAVVVARQKSEGTHP